MLAHADAFTVSLGKELAIPTAAIVASKDRELIGRARQFCFDQGTTLEPWGWCIAAAGAHHLLEHPSAIAEREAKTRTLARHLEDAHVAVAKPTGGHAVFVELRSQEEGVESLLSLLSHLFVIAGVTGQIGTWQGRRILRLALPLYSFSATELAAAAAGVAEFLHVETEAPRLRIIPGQDEVVPFFRRLRRG